jgi:hypothetical protein
MRQIVILVALCAVVLSSASGAGCVQGGGNQNQQTPGNQDNGVALHFGDLAIDPTGRYVVYGAGEILQVGDLATGAKHKLDAVTSPQRVSFGPPGSGLLYVVGDHDARRVVAAVDLATRRVRWSRPAAVEAHAGETGFSILPWIDATADGRFVVLTSQKKVEVVKTADGRLARELPLDQMVMDVDLTPDSSRVIVTELHRWSGDAPTTRITALDLDGGEPARIEAPNCSSELVLAPDGRRAFLAPTLCRRDPVSVIDLVANRFERNLPGFGPVAVAADGTLAVAFIDAGAIERALFDDPADIPSLEDGRYHLMLIDTATLEFDTVPIGETLPRYTITPDGRVLLVDSSFWVAGTDADARVRLLDVASRRLVPLSGDADVRLESYVMTADAERVYLLHHGLWRVDVAGARLTSIMLPFVPVNLNITADDAFLILRESETALWLFDVRRDTLVGRLDTTPIALARLSMLR